MIFWTLPKLFSQTKQHSSFKIRKEFRNPYVCRGLGFSRKLPLGTKEIFENRGENFANNPMSFRSSFESACVCFRSPISFSSRKKTPEHRSWIFDNPAKKILPGSSKNFLLSVRKKKLNLTSLFQEIHSPTKFCWKKKESLKIWPKFFCQKSEIVLLSLKLKLEKKLSYNLPLKFRVQTESEVLKTKLMGFHHRSRNLCPSAAKTDAEFVSKEKVQKKLLQDTWSAVMTIKSSSLQNNTEKFVQNPIIFNWIFFQNLMISLETSLWKPKVPFS